MSLFKPRMTTHFNGNSGEIASFQVSVEHFLNHWGYQFPDEAEVIEYISAQLDGAASQWYINLYRSGEPELYSLAEFFRSMEIQFGEPALTENAHTDLKNLKQGSMSVKDSVKFCVIATNLQGWRESLLVDYYRDGLNVELVCKAIDYSNPQSLVDWIQAASDMEARNFLVKSVKQHRSPPQLHKSNVNKGQSSYKPPADLKREQHFKAGRCLTCGRAGHYAASCPLLHAAAAPAKLATRPPPPKKSGAKPSARSALTEALKGLTLEDNMGDFEKSADVSPPGNGRDLLQ